MVIDPNSLPVLFLKPLLDPVTVKTDLVGHTTGQQWVEVVLVDFGEEVENCEFSADFAFYAYGPDKKTAVALIMKVFDSLMHSMRNQTVNGVYVNDVRHISGPLDNSDEVSGEQRYLFVASIYYT